MLSALLPPMVLPEIIIGEMAAATFLMPLKFVLAAVMPPFEMVIEPMLLFEIVLWPAAVVLIWIPAEKYEVFEVLVSSVNVIGFVPSRLPMVFPVMLKIPLNAAMPKNAGVVVVPVAADCVMPEITLF